MWRHQKIPRKISMSSKYFRPLFAIRARVSDSDDRNNNKEITKNVENHECDKELDVPQFQRYVSGWMPCTKSNPDAIERSYMDVLGNVIHPQLMPVSANCYKYDVHKSSFS